MIHQYKNNGYNIVLDINSGSVHVVDDVVYDVISLYEYGYNNYSLKTIANEKDVATQIEVSNATKDTKQLDLLVSENINALVDNSENTENIEPNIVLNDEIKAPIYGGDVLGKVSYTVNGVEYTTDLVASHDVEEFRIPTFIIYIALIFVALLLIYRIFYYTPKKYKRTKRYYR